MLVVKNLTAKVQNKQILDKINLEIKENEMHFLLGPNGSGKSTLAKVLMGIDDIDISQGEIKFFKEDLLSLSINERAKRGLFLANQYPPEIEGVNYADFLKIAYENRFNKKITIDRFLKILKKYSKMLNFTDDFLDRNLNEGFSGGEKKRSEILQMALLKPKLAILDETDSGLDIDAVKVVFKAIKNLKEKNKDMSLLVITHSDKIFKFLKPDYVHIMKNGKIIKSGNIDLSKEIFIKGFSFD